MIRIATVSVILMFCLLGGGMMLAAGESVLRVALLLSGIVVITVGANRAMSRARSRQNRPDGLTVTRADLASLNRHDWIRLLLVLLTGGGLCGLALVAFRSGAQ